MAHFAQVETLLNDVQRVRDKQMNDRKKSVGMLLSEVGRIIKLQEKYEKLKGEKFNVFSILGVEERENKHSAFIRELLDPNGSHLKGNIFLKLFLDTIEFEERTGKKLDVTSIRRVAVEENIGTVDYNTKTGGRIDIYIEDKAKESVSIENKIYAADQPSQIERYCKHNEGRNTVFYLTLMGDDPSFESKGELTEGKNYFNIFYKKHIIAWLELCLKESAEQPILRETIKQYIVSIRRLTSTMNDDHEKTLYDMLLRNYDAANYIYENLPAARQNFCEQLCDLIVEKLDVMKSDGYTIERNRNIKSRTFVQIKLNGEAHQKSRSCFAFGPFEHIKEDLFFGIYDCGGANIYAENLDKQKVGKRDDKEWPHFRYFDFHGKSKNLVRLLPELCAEKNKEEFVERIAGEVRGYIIGKHPSGGGS